MIATLVNAACEKASIVNWKSFAPLCAAESCRHRTRWQGILRRSTGVHFEDKWFCGSECLQQELDRRIAEVLNRPRTPSERQQHRMPLGLLLLSRGILEQQQLNETLRTHRESGERFGTCVRKLGLASERQITAALAAQWGCPVYSSAGVSNCDGLIPRLLQESHRMTPMHWVESARCLFVGFEQKVEYTLLFAIEQMLDCHTEPCIVDESEITRILRRSSAATDDEVRFASARTANEMAIAAASYAQQLEAERVRLAQCPQHIWLRVERNKSSFHLLFEKP